MSRSHSWIRSRWCALSAAATEWKSMAEDELMPWIELGMESVRLYRAEKAAHITTARTTRLGRRRHQPWWRLRRLHAPPPPPPRPPAPLKPSPAARQRRNRRRPPKQLWRNRQREWRYAPEKLHSLFVLYYLYCICLPDCFTFLVPAHPGSPGKRAVKRVCVCIVFAP